MTTVFIADLTKSSMIANAARNSLKRLKILRHPQILKLFDGVEVDGKIYIATEPVKPFTQLQSKVCKSQDHLLWNIHSLIVQAIYVIDLESNLSGRMHSSL